MKEKETITSYVRNAENALNNGNLNEMKQNLTKFEEMVENEVKQIRKENKNMLEDPDLNKLNNEYCMVLRRYRTEYIR